MFGLCMPTGDTYLLMKDGKQESIMLSDECQPKKHIMESKYVLEAVKHKGYENIEAIVYQPNYKSNKNKTVVSMAEYYYENAEKLDRVED